MARGATLTGMTTNPVIASGGASCRSAAIPTYDRVGDCHGPNDGPRGDRIDTIRSASDEAIPNGAPRDCFVAKGGLLAMTCSNAFVLSWLGGNSFSQRGL